MQQQAIFLVMIFEPNFLPLPLSGSDQMTSLEQQVQPCNQGRRLLQAQVNVVKKLRSRQASRVKRRMTDCLQHEGRRDEPAPFGLGGCSCKVDMFLRKRERRLAQLSPINEQMTITFCI